MMIQHAAVLHLGFWSVSTASLFSGDSWMYLAVSFVDDEDDIGSRCSLMVSSSPEGFLQGNSHPDDVSMLFMLDLEDLGNIEGSGSLL